MFRYFFGGFTLCTAAFMLTAVCALTASTVFPAQANAAEPQPTVLITGANRGIGLELARQMDAKGYRVIATAREPDQAQALHALKVRVEALDVTNADSVAALAKRLDGVAVDLLINNAGVGGQSGGLSELDLDKFSRTFAVNSIGPMRVTQALLDNLAAGTGKKVIHISSIMASIESSWGGSYDYRASKTALNMLNKSLAIELGKKGFVCVALHPGWVKTRMGGESAPVELPDSVRGLLGVIEGLETADNGRFYDYQGKELPW